ncbi:MAG: tRNA preQ1(34) S-adenosylmethionine ribosyltransferase-isomerase QueA [Bradymonadaceae bacterium]|nr:tRNA preQ1(34) S-adenosylmethionine ribosyltransferase-isomerase QueA [Lujinxingiaceae bacterium]
MVQAYDYELSDALIAEHPANERDASRLLVANRHNGSIVHRGFADIGEYLFEDDLLVFNDTRVIAGRIMANKSSGGQVELLVLDVLEPGGLERFAEPAGGRLCLECMTRSSKPLRVGMELAVENAFVSAPFVVEACEPGRARLSIAWDDSALALLSLCGQMPLPPYIVQKRRRTQPERSFAALDEERYQTVYASAHGAIAAPTAGLHFTDALLSSLEARGIRRAFVTLKVGAGTFKPVVAERLSEHAMHSEEYIVEASLGEAIERTRSVGGRVIAVGTTSARALEAEAGRALPFSPGARQTDIFLYPGAPFKVCDALITNFHLPRSTLLALVAGFAGYDLMRAMYAEAVAHGYRFYSYGDSSLIV